MRMPWLPQVRLLHMVLFALAAATCILYVAYLTSPPATAPAALRAANSTPAPSAAPTARANATDEPAPSTAPPPPPPAVCAERGRRLRLFVGVISAPDHAAERLAIRETWGHFSGRRDVAVAFMLGVARDPHLNRQIVAEQNLYGDIIQGRFFDTYDNLTLKTIALMEWVERNCMRVRFVLKTDDDMFINVSKLLEFITKHSANERIIYGRLAERWKPIRNKRSKYYISFEEYKAKVFPNFTTGPAYLLPGRLASELYRAALNETYLKLEDVFMTGIVASGLNITRVNAVEFYNLRMPYTSCSLKNVISVHKVNRLEQYEWWKKLKVLPTKNCQAKKEQ